MNVCIIGDGLTSLSLAKNLINKKINVTIYQKKIFNKISPNRTIGISKNNLEFFEKEILKISKKICWEIKKIEIYSEKLKSNKILNFERNKENLFYMVKNKDLYKLLNNKLIKNKYFKKKIIKKNFLNENLLRNYNLIINCDQNNPIYKKFFIKKIKKNYQNIAYTTILEHERTENNSAVQIFTHSGPIAYLPISKSKTSVVCSLDIKSKIYDTKEILGLINKHNPKYKIKKIQKLSNFELKASNLRNYYHNNILAFGDLLHRIHPLAGQGFNMTIRDIRDLSEIIQERINLGIQIDSSILKDFQNKTKNKNLIFSSGVNLIYEFFNIDKNFKDKNLNKILKTIGGNKSFTDLFIKFADKGLSI